MNFDKILIIGEGKVALNCKNIAEKFFNKQIYNISTTRQEKLDDFFENITNSLIISANNFYIFKEYCIANNFIINYHNSLLPNHRGSNAHIWSIWENDSKSGITWHKVDCNIDTGNIILQKEIKLDKTLTAIKLLQLQQNLAISSFEECLQKIYNELNLEKQDKKGKFHKKNDIPNKGILDISWDIDKISRFLRAMDHGNTNNKGKINISNQNFEISTYAINEEYIKINLNNIIITKYTNNGDNKWN